MHRKMHFTDIFQSMIWPNIVIYQIKALKKLQLLFPNTISGPDHTFKDNEVQRFLLLPLMPPFPTKCPYPFPIHLVLAEFIFYTIGSLSF